MFASRTASRAAAAAGARARTSPLHAPMPMSMRHTARQTRLVSTTQAEGAKAGGASGFAAGVAGGALVLVGCYTYYHFSGAKSVVDAYSSTKNQFKKATSALSEKAPEPRRAVQWLRGATSSYAALIPGAQSFLDKAFDEVEKVQEKHGEEVDEIVHRMYEELKDLGRKGGLDVQSAVRVWSVLTKALGEIAEVGKDGLGELLDGHPEIREKVGGNLEKLKGMVENLGPDAKGELDDTYKKVSEILAGGVGVGSLEKVRKLIQEKSEKVRKVGEQAWEKGLDEWKADLEKHPKVKQMLEENADLLKSGNVTKIFEQVRRAIESGNTEELGKYIKDAGEKAKDSGLGQNVQQYAKQAAEKLGIPGSEKIWERLQRLQEVAKDHGDELEGLVKSAYEEIGKVVEKKVAEAEKLRGKVEKDVKK
ncbi:hypothetical protein DSL72_003756 [Monilinia vaccinii-corymbosi]|uniref:Uncharacterized protein n=1 Tax=Monilinia vaccinii-corymbosi TaxID=61207 RepID=A0A8A3P0H4_9HELO|nr:hypothetical protein DSL72_003756 [Monilinia vaccinii-corymbosi]